MSTPHSTPTSVGADKPVFVSSSFMPTVQETHPSKLRSLLPKNLLSQVSKTQVSGTEPLQILNNSEGKMCTYTSNNSLQISEMGLHQLGEEVSSSPDTVDSLLKHLSRPSSSHVIALTDAQVQKLLSKSPSPSTGPSNKPQVLHMVTVEDGVISPQSLPVILEHQPLSVSIEDHSVSIMEEPVSLESPSQTPAASPPSVTPLPSASDSRLQSANLTEVTAQVPTESVKSVPSTSQSVHLTNRTDSKPSLDSTSLRFPSQSKDREEVVKKTMVEAFVKMVVCRKVTVQKVNSVTGQVLDTKVKLEEEEPVILGVDCVETTEDLISSASSTGASEEKTSPAKWGSSLDGGLKFLSAVSESQQKLGKSLIADALLKSSLKSQELGVGKKVAEGAGVVQVSDTVSQGGVDVKIEARNVSDSDWNDEEDCNDDSEDYVPGKEKSTNSSHKQNLKCSLSKKQAQEVKTLGSKAGARKSVAVSGSYKKRGRKRRWDNALGIAPNLKTCSFCNKAFKTSETCARHMKKGQCVPAVYCFLCNKPFEDEKDLEVHLTTHEEKSKSGTFECTDCNRLYRTRAGFLKHFRMGTCLKRDEFEDGEVGEYACDICSSQFTTEAYLKLHKYKVHENPADKHTCPDCGKTFYSMQGYNKHRSGRPCTEPLKCKICGKTYSSKAKESFKIHMRHHRTEATGVMFDCDECDRSYMTLMALNKHKLSHTGVKPYKCDICGKEFAMRYMVKDHARTHTGERPYPCTLCGSAFSNRGHLGRHMRSHENGTLLKRGRPKKVKEAEETPLGLKIIDISSTLQQLDRQTIQVVDGQMLDSQVSGAPMIIRTDNNTIIITEGWPAGSATPGPDVPPEQPSDTGTEVVCSIASVSNSVPHSLSLGNT